MTCESLTAPFSVRAAQEAAQQGRLEAWVHVFLSSGPWADPTFVSGLRGQRRWWLGPFQVPLAMVPRTCGPEPGLEYPQDREGWERKVTAMAAGIDDPWRCLRSSPSIGTAS